MLTEQNMMLQALFNNNMLVTLLKSIQHQNLKSIIHFFIADCIKCVRTSLSIIIQLWSHFTMEDMCVIMYENIYAK